MATKTVSNANSKGLILDYLNGTPKGSNNFGMFGRNPRFDPVTALKVVRNDPTVRAALITLIDKFFEGGYRIEGKDSRSKQKEAKTRLEELRFDKYNRKIMFHGLLFNNAFGEIIKKGGKVSDLNVIEPATMRIEADDNGDVSGYYQETGNRSKDANTPRWTTDEVVHYKFDDYTTNVWAEFNVEALYETCLIKDYIRQWLQWFFGTNQLRPVLVIKSGASDTKIKEFISFLKSAEKNLMQPLPFSGELDIQKLQSFADEGKSVLDVLKWCDEQILALMQIPPIAVGFPDQSGRSNSVEQYTALYTRINSLQKQFSDTTTYELFPKIGYEKMEFCFGVLDSSVRKSTFEMVQLMKQSQFTNEAIIEFLEEQGIVFETEKVLMDPEDLIAMNNKDLGTGNEGMKGNKSADSAPSRTRQGDKEASKATTQVKNAESHFDKRFW
jgi:hypothetical protein